MELYLVAIGLVISIAVNVALIFLNKSHKTITTTLSTPFPPNIENYLKEILMHVKEANTKIEGEAVTIENNTILLNQLVAKQADIKAIQSTVAEVKAENDAIKAQLSQAQIDLANKQAEIEATKAQLAQAANDAAAAVASKQAELDSANSNVAVNDANKQAEIEALKAQLAQAQSDLAQAIADQDLADASIQRLQKANADQTAAIQALNSSAA